MISMGLLCKKIDYFFVWMLRVTVRNGRGVWMVWGRSFSSREEGKEYPKKQRKEKSLQSFTKYVEKRNKGIDDASLAGVRGGDWIILVDC